MIGYYVHDVGVGHLQRARAVAACSSHTVVGLSSLEPPEDWTGPWVRLESDALGPRPQDADAGGGLHWAPQHDDGLRRRMAALSTWIGAARPEAVVSDVSVEVALLARLHGVPVVSVVLPGDRGDRPHRTGYGVSSALVALWPEVAHGMVRGLTPPDAARLRHVGGLSRLPVGAVADVRAARSRRDVLLLLGRGGGHPDATQVAAAASGTPGWRWRVLGGPGEWAADPTTAIDDADVVVLIAGESAVADVAARRRPAVVVAAERPFGEQRATARVLDAGPWPCRSAPGFAAYATAWPDLLEKVARLDGAAWETWCDGGAAQRFAGVVDSVAGTGGRRR